MSNLETYRRKRNFERTPEPSGAGASLSEMAESTKGGKFVIHKHAASHLHYDLRLEQDGVLVSWAVPKGPSLVPGEKRLAVKVEDHPLEYGDFEGVIPAKEYGGGTVMLWDRGHWVPMESSAKKNEERIDFVLSGEKLRGAWTLVHTGREKKTSNQWMLIKRHDAWADENELTDLSVATGRTMEQIALEGKTLGAHKKAGKSTRSKGLDLSAVKGAKKGALPQAFSPVLAKLAKETPTGTEWLHEIKFDGYRIITKFSNGDVQLFSRNGLLWTRRFTEVTQLLQGLAARNAVLDGEVISLTDDGTSSFRGLQEALAAKDTRGLVYQIFDLLFLDGYDLTGAPLIQRKQILQELLRRSNFGGSDLIRYTDHISGQGPDFLQKACVLGLEGIISKKVDSAYRSGRSGIWVKTKCSNHEEFLVCGYTRPNGSRKGFGSLLLAAWHKKKLIYTGRVGTGFSNALMTSLYEKLRRLEIEECPLSIFTLSENGVRWVRPELVAEVEFSEWTRDGVLRHSTFRGLREDKDPQDIQLPQAAIGKAVPTESESLGEERAPAKKKAGKKISGAAKPSASEASGEKARAKVVKSNVIRKNRVEVAGVPLSNPERIFFPDQGITKLQVAQFYEDIAEWILPLIERRPLSLVRCPSGHNGECFFQKHPKSALSKDIPQVEIAEKEGTKPYLYIETLPHLIGLVQAGALELHIWGSRVDDVERPDQLVFDLDPASDVSLTEIFRVARELRDRLSELGFICFPRVTGGKGLHLVVPLTPQLEWPEVKAFCRTIAQQAAADDKKRLTANMAKSKRHGRTFIDYLRNGRSATAIASYSTRARSGAPVAVPVNWDELNEALKPTRYTIENLRRRLTALKRDPWADFENARRPLTAKILDQIGVTDIRD